MSGSEAHPIAALASGGGASALAVLRLTGPGIFDLVSPCLVPMHDGAWRARKMRLCKFTDPRTGTVLDELLAVRFPGPRSFTGQDLVELHAHGGPYVVRKILETLYGAGFRPAEPGEFTRRAFLAGKLDLTAAEGIGALVTAASHQQWLAARHLVSGKLRDRIEELRTILVECMAYLEAQIDFPDEGDTAHLHRSHVRERAGKVDAAIARLASTFDSGKVASEGLMVALYGEPNAGKSTLMNELLGQERAIVTDIPGTTRDYLEEKCLIDGRLIRLVDMAGVRDASDAVERIGVERALKIAAEADLVLALAPANALASAVQALDRKLEDLGPKRIVKVLTKADLGAPIWAKDRLILSCKTGHGLNDLRTTLAQAVESHVRALDTEEAFVTSARHAAALTEAQSFMSRFREADADGAFDELLAFELQQAARALKRVVGDVDVEDVLDAIFIHFCVGK